MNCLQVRDALPEYALGVAGDVAPEIDRHLEWCAACRKEARDLERAAAAVGFALEPQDPSPSLKDRVVTGVRSSASSRRRSAGPRAAAVVLAAALAISGLGWGAVMAGRATQVEDQARKDVAATKQQLDSFREYVESALFVDPGTKAYLGALEPVGPFGTAAGSAMSIVSPGVDDRVIVIVNGLPDRPALLPYRVTVSDGQGPSFALGPIATLDQDGGATTSRITPRQLDGYRNVVVRDARGRVVLQGVLTVQAPVASPSTAPPSG